MNTGIITAVLINLLFSKTIQGIFNIHLGFDVFWIWLNFTGVVIALVVAYVVSALTKVKPKSAESLKFRVKKSDIFSKEVYILVTFFVAIIIFSFMVPQLFGK